MGWLRSRLAALARWLAGDSEAASGGATGSRTSIRTKFLLMMLPATLIGLGIITLFASQTGKQSLTDAAFNQLTSYRAAKTQQIERYFRDMRDTFSILGTDPAIVAAYKDLKAGQATLGNPPIDDDRLGMHGKHTKSDRPCLRSVGSGPERQGSDGRYRTSSAKAKNSS